jgi:hypothetical protein
VEDTLFKVPKNHFLASSVFATIFTLPPGKEDVEGTEDKPFVLHEISEVDFESLLKFMHPPPLWVIALLEIQSPLILNSCTSTNGKLTKQEWLSVLKLCTLWEFTQIRERAIEELSENDPLGTVDKIVHGKSYDVGKWVLDGSVELLEGNKTITNEEAERIGWRTAAKLLLLREQYHLTTGQLGLDYDPTCLKCHSSSCRGQFYRTCNGYNGYHSCAQPPSTSRDQYDFKNAVKKELGLETEPTRDQK